MKTLLTIVLCMMSAIVAHADPRAPSKLWIKEGYVSDVKQEADPSAVAVLVTDKFTALSLDREATIANDVCTTISKLSQRPGKAPDEAVGLCDLMLKGTDNQIGSTTFDDDGKAVTRWQVWYLRTKKAKG